MWFINYEPPKSPLIIEQVIQEKIEQPKPKEIKDPNNCEPAMYWAEEAPYYCIPKPNTQVSNQRRSEPTKNGSQASYSSAGNTYQAGQCVWGIKEWRSDIPNGWGSAYQWLSSARSSGWSTGVAPKVNAVGVAGNHVVLITSVNSDGTVSYKDMNGRYVPFEVGYGNKPASYYTYIY